MAEDPTPAIELSERDLNVLRYVARFKQLSSSQIRSLLFYGHNNTTPADRALRRLVSRSYLHRIERRIVGGTKGGSGQYVYELGRRGFFLFFTGRHNPSRTVHPHSLGIADSYITLRQLERAGRLRIAGMSTEPDCWATVGGVDLRPDMRADLDIEGRRVLFWVEVDMATESQKQLRGKLESYWRAYNDADVEQWPVFPRTIWIAVDDERARELSWLVSQMPEQSRALFVVCTPTTLPALFGGTVDKS